MGIPTTGEEGDFARESLVSGRLLDEKGNGVSNQKINANILLENRSISDSSVQNILFTTDTNGYFSQDIAFKSGSIFKSKNETREKITLTFLPTQDDTTLRESYLKGETISFFNPYKIIYDLKTNLNDKTSLAVDGRAYYLNPDGSGTLRETTKKLSSNVILLKKEKFFNKQNKDEQETKVKTEKRINTLKAAITKNPLTANYSAYNEEEIIDAFPSNNDAGNSVRNLMSPTDGGTIAFAFHNSIKILQVVGNDGFLFTVGSKTFYGKKMPNCVKGNYYDGQQVEMVGVINGTYSYTTALGTSTRVPKVNIYAITPYRYY